LRVLVTGHDGYLGSVLVRIIEDAGYEVIGLDSDLFSPCTFDSNGHRVDAVHADVRDVESEHLADFEAENYRIRDLAEIGKDVVPGTRASLADGGGPDRRSYWVDCSKIARVLRELETRWTVRRGVEELYEAHARNGRTFEEFTGTSYLRINRVRELQQAGRLDDELRWRPPVEVA
jgi:NAD dependent epimerase/dehydratase family